MKTQDIVLHEHIDHARERQYYELPFDVPAGVCRIDIAYRYERHRVTEEENGVTTRREVNIVDLALRDGAGNYVGSSGSDRTHIYVSGWESAQGYAKVEIRAGRWAIIVGAYKIEPAGLDVEYTVTFTFKERRLLRGDTHVHTLGSDGCMSVRDTAETARRLGLDYIFITDHNNYAHNLSSPDVAGITVLPGTEWTHYDGHAGLLGVVQPFRSAFCVNSAEEAWAKLAEARENGALIVLNHPFCPNCGWHFGMDGDQYDVIEISNGSMHLELNRDCLRWWHEELCRGRRLPIIGGSDFHRFEPLRLIGLPTTNLYALSPSPEDILDAVRGGNGFVTMQIGGPTVWAQAGDAILGQSAPAGTPVEIVFENVRAGDRLSVITDQGREDLVVLEAGWRMQLTRSWTDACFCRFEVERDGVSMLISNPIYFDEKM